MRSIWRAKRGSAECSPGFQISLSLLRNVGPALERHVVGSKGFGLLQGTLQLASNFSVMSVESRTERRQLGLVVLPRLLDDRGMISAWWRKYHPVLLAHEALKAQPARSQKLLLGVFRSHGGHGHLLLQ